ncbi:unannotated protein [freshwater metagenome]|uniref:Unannotated protein n=1 Tax=freshwater metagenome TaxID=449393 RepID=A0A6J6HC47_9ZZZZ
MVTPTTKRLGFNVSSTAKPSRKNSGFHAKSDLGFISINLFLNFSAVPTGTVDFPTTNAPGFAILATDSNAAFT